MTGSAQAQVPFEKMKAPDQISELFYQRAVEVTKPVYLAINRAYPQEARKDNPKTEYRFQEAHRQAKQHLNFHKKAVRDWVDTFVLAKRHKTDYDASQDAATTQLRQVLDVQLLTLYQRLCDYAPIMVPAEDLESCLTVLKTRYESALEGLHKDLAPYEADPKVSQDEYIY